MAKELSIISSNLLMDVKESEVNGLIERMVEKSKSNMEEITELTLECTTLLSSAENRSVALSNQGVFKRLVGNITGKNTKMRNAILQNNTNALYAAQGVINRVMLECTNNRELLLSINDRVSDLYLELKENQNDVSAAVLMVRQAIVAFYKEYQEEIIAQDKRISKVEEYVKTKCSKCGTELLSWQRICPCCGYIHSLKTEKNSNETMRVLKQISDIVKDNSLSEDIVWNETARKAERALQKVKKLASLGKVPGYTDELSSDIENLINKCKDAEFQIAVVGVMKAGKSFLMNALIGAEIASVEVNPETAALTKFRSANGYYVIVRFHNNEQWKKLKQSAEDSKKTGRDSLISRLNDPITIKMESEWVNHDDLKIECKNLEELQEVVKKYTSSRAIEHIFVSEVEVGVDRKLFNMPKEVVFVDTPGLKDPVKYRSNITKKYIKKADAVLIALKPGALTTEGVEIVTTVLDCTDTDKAYIVGTQKDINSDSDCEKYVSNWVEHLVNAKRYSDNRKAKNRIILTSAKMDLLVHKWEKLSETEKEDENKFSFDDFKDLESYSAKSMKKRSFNLMQMTPEEIKAVSDSTGIPTLRAKLECTLIANYRKLKIDDITKSYISCRKRLTAISQNAIKKQESDIDLAIAGAETLQKQIENMDLEKTNLKQQNEELKKAIEKLENSLKNKISELERKEK